jgi:hypothetical protein
MVSSKLCVARGGREGRLRHKFVCLVVEILCDITPQKAVDEGSLRFIVLS